MDDTSSVADAPWLKCGIAEYLRCLLIINQDSEAVGGKDRGSSSPMFRPIPLFWHTKRIGEWERNLLELYWREKDPGGGKDPQRPAPSNGAGLHGDMQAPL